MFSNTAKRLYIAYSDRVLERKKSIIFFHVMFFLDWFLFLSGFFFYFMSIYTFFMYFFYPRSFLQLGLKYLNLTKLYIVHLWSFNNISLAQLLNKHLKKIYSMFCLHFVYFSFRAKFSPLSYHIRGNQLHMYNASPILNVNIHSLFPQGC